MTAICKVCGHELVNDTCAYCEAARKLFEVYKDSEKTEKPKANVRKLKEKA